MKRHLFIPWIGLLLLTTIGYMNRSGAEGSSFAIPLIVAAIKFSLVAWFFMELRTVSRFWAFGIGSLLTIILGIATVLQLQN